MNKDEERKLAQLKFFIHAKGKRQIKKQWVKFLKMFVYDKHGSVDFAKAIKFMLKHLSKHEENIAKSRKF